MQAKGSALGHVASHPKPVQNHIHQLVQEIHQIPREAHPTLKQQIRLHQQSLRFLLTTPHKGMEAFIYLVLWYLEVIGPTLMHMGISILLIHLSLLPLGFILLLRSYPFPPPPPGSGYSSPYSGYQSPPASITTPPISLSPSPHSLPLPSPSVRGQFTLKFITSRISKCQGCKGILRSPGTSLPLPPNDLIVSRSSLHDS